MTEYEDVWDFLGRDLPVKTGMTREELWELADQANITIDGKPAILAARGSTFMVVAALDRSTGGVEFSDRAIESVLTTKNGAFKS